MDALQQAIDRHGAHVPNYNIAGRQHPRIPHKDQGRLVNLRPHPRWANQPLHSTREELLSARRVERLPDPSCDVDGDGVVSHADHFISRHFAEPQSSRLDTGGRERVVEALEGGWLEKFSFGHDQSGCHRPFRVYQKQGKIITVDNANAIADLFPPHPISSVVPNFHTTGELVAARKGELRNAAHSMKAKWDEANPGMIPEPQPPMNMTAPGLRGRRAVDRREERRAEARREAGLEETSRDLRAQHEVKGEYVDEPKHSTRRALEETRRAQHRTDLAATREEAAKYYVPISVKNEARDEEIFQRNQPKPGAMTLTQLQIQRRAERFEANLRTEKPPQEAPSFAGMDGSWWQHREGYTHEPSSDLLRKKAAEREKDFLVKVNQVAPPPRSRPIEPDPLHPSHPTGRPPKEHDELGQKTLKGFQMETARGNAVLDALNDESRHDGVRQAIELSTDSQTLDALSSFRIIRQRAKQADEQHRERIAAEIAERQQARRVKDYGLPDRVSQELPDQAPPPQQQSSQHDDASLAREASIEADNNGANTLQEEGAAGAGPRDPGNPQNSVSDRTSGGGSIVVAARGSERPSSLLRKGSVRSGNWQTSKRTSGIVAVNWTSPTTITVQNFEDPPMTERVNRQSQALSGHNNTTLGKAAETPASAREAVASRGSVRRAGSTVANEANNNSHSHSSHNNHTAPPGGLATPGSAPHSANANNTTNTIAADAHLHNSTISAANNINSTNYNGNGANTMNNTNIVVNNGLLASPRTGRMAVRAGGFQWLDRFLTQQVAEGSKMSRQPSVITPTKGKGAPLLRRDSSLRRTSNISQGSISAAVAAAAQAEA